MRTPFAGNKDGFKYIFRIISKIISSKWIGSISRRLFLR